MSFSHSLQYNPTHLSHNWSPGIRCRCSRICSGSSPLCTDQHCHRGCCYTASAVHGCRNCSHQARSGSRPGGGHRGSCHRWRGRGRSPRSRSWAAPSKPLAAGWGLSSARAAHPGTYRCPDPRFHCPLGSWRACCGCWLRSNLKTQTQTRTRLLFNTEMQKHCDVLANGYIDLTVAG